MKSLFSFFIITAFLPGGCGSDSENNDYDDVTVKQAKDTAHSYIENNYQDIISIELEEPYQAPIGSLTIEGTVNVDHYFTIRLDSNFKITSIGENKGLS